VSTVRGLAIVLVLLVLVIAGAVVSAQAQAPMPIRCEAGMCMISQIDLAELVRQAEATERYAVMCGWGKE
jgi:hypothetical protein